MAHYAKVNNGIVEQVIVAESDFIEGLDDSNSWVKTSYNTCAGVHNDGGEPLRGNFAGIGMVYDSQRDCFYDPQPFPSWTLNEETFSWEPPISYPINFHPTEWEWDEDNRAWTPV